MRRLGGVSPSALRHPDSLKIESRAYSAYHSPKNAGGKMQVAVVDYRSPEAPKQFAESLRELGFAVLANHPLNQKLIDDAYSEWEAFFAGKDKENYAFNAETHDGFINTVLSETAKGNDKKDLKEFYHYYPWGRCPNYLRPTTQKLYDGLEKLSVELLLWIQNHMPSDIQKQLSMPLGEMIQDSPKTLFRLIHYPPLRGDEPADAMRAAAHEDIDLLTLLVAASEPGLQVKNKQGEWLDVPTRKDWIIVNTGDMLAECTNDFYKATTHRVKNPTGEAAKKSRLSMPIFLHPRNEVILSQRHTGASYREERFKELGLL